MCEEKFKPGDEVEVSSDGKTWTPAQYLNPVHRVRTESYTLPTPTVWKYCRKAVK